MCVQITSRKAEILLVVFSCCYRDNPDKYQQGQNSMCLKDLCYKTAALIGTN